jgi:RHS repeat-associated protein
LFYYNSVFFVYLQAVFIVKFNLGSTTALTSTSGAIIESASYDSFGNATGNLSTRYGFTGREFDADLGLQYSRARWYDATLGRFISEDPIGFAGGDVNLYGYVRNNPVNFKDPTGKIILPVLIVGGAVAAEGIFHLYLGSVAGKIPWKDGDG